MECCRAFPEGQIRFARYFKRSWYNKLKRLYRDAYALKRQGKEVELEKAEVMPQQKVTDDFLEKMKARYEEICPLLSIDAKRLLVALLDPPQVVVEVAWREFCRKHKARSQGRTVRGLEKFRIKTRHIRKALGMSHRRMREVVAEIKAVNKKHSGGK